MYYFFFLLPTHLSEKNWLNAQIGTRAHFSSLLLRSDNPYTTGKLRGVELSNMDNPLEPNFFFTRGGKDSIFISNFVDVPYYKP